MTALTDIPPTTTHRTPTDVMLAASLVAGPIVYLAADSTYAASGWDSPVGAALHIVGAILYGLVILQLASRLPDDSVLRAVIIGVGLIGLAGNVAYGFDAIHASLGDQPLVAQAGIAGIIKPLGLFFPLSLLLAGVGLWRTGSRWPAAAVLIASILWPVAHIANIAPLAVAVNVVLVVSIGSLLRQRAAGPRAE